MDVHNFFSAQTVYESSRKRKLANNTYLDKVEDYYTLRLHNTIIIQYHLNKTVLNSGGYMTMTTKARLNEFTNFNIWQEKGVWYIRSNNGNWDKSIIFADNCHYDGKKWHGIKHNDKALLKMRQAIKQYCKAYVKNLFAGKIPSPSGADCWDCCLMTEKGKTFGELRDSDHIKSHIVEKYYVPSLLLRAIEIFPISEYAKGVIYYIWNNKTENVYSRMSSLSSLATRQIESSLKRYCYRQTKSAS